MQVVYAENMRRQSPDIHKAAAIIIEDRKLLVVCNRDKGIFVAPGGKLLPGESGRIALARELKEELDIDVEIEDMELFGTSYAIAAGTDKSMVMDTYEVQFYSGTIKPSSEVDEIAWIDSTIPEGMKLGSVFEKEVIPRLKKADLID